jgi:hypothetical protein
MPRAFSRILAVALLGLIVPLQGMAAVAAGQCMAFGHHEESDTRQGHAHDSANDHGHAAQAHDHGETTPPADEGANNAHCGPCTACCATASIAAPISLSLPSFASNTKYLFLQSSPPAVELRGVDRPPLAL